MWCTRTTISFTRPQAGSALAGATTGQHGAADLPGVHGTSKPRRSLAWALVEGSSPRTRLRNSRLNSVCGGRKRPSSAAAQAHTHTCAHAQARKHTNTHTQAHKHTHKQAHTRPRQTGARTHAYPLPPPRYRRTPAARPRRGPPGRMRPHRPRRLSPRQPRLARKQAPTSAARRQAAQRACVRCVFQSGCDVLVSE
jgi:hypothetical protein